MISKILDRTGFTVVHVEATATARYLSLECESDHGICPHCGVSRQQVRLWYPRLVKDLPIRGKACYL